MYFSKRSEDLKTHEETNSRQSRKEDSRSMLLSIKVREPPKKQNIIKMYVFCSCHRVCQRDQHVMGSRTHGCGAVGITIGNLAARLQIKFRQPSSNMVRSGTTKAHMVRVFVDHKCRRLENTNLQRTTWLPSALGQHDTTTKTNGFPLLAHLSPASTLAHITGTPVLHLQ